jgi:hypothetical protein
MKASGTLINHNFSVIEVPFRTLSRSKGFGFTQEIDKPCRRIIIQSGVPHVYPNALLFVPTEQLDGLSFQERQHAIDASFPAFSLKCDVCGPDVNREHDSCHLSKEHSITWS